MTQSGHNSRFAAGGLGTGGLLNAKEPALLVAVSRIHRVVQSGTLDEPWLELFVYVENQHKVFVLKVATYRRVMADTGTKNRCACEVDDVSTARVIGAPEFVSEGIRRQISEHGDITGGGGPGDVGEFVVGQS